MRKHPYVRHSFRRQEWPEGSSSRGCSSVGRAPPCQGGGRGFETRHPLAAAEPLEAQSSRGEAQQRTVAQLGSAHDWGSWGRRFKSSQSDAGGNTGGAPAAQPLPAPCLCNSVWSEYPTLNGRVPGSNPGGGTTRHARRKRAGPALRRLTYRPPWTAGQPTHARIAQWQSSGFTLRRSGVRVPVCARNVRLRGMAPPEGVRPPRQGPGAVCRPAADTCGRSSVGRASAFQAECRGFEPRRPLGRHTPGKLLLAHELSIPE